MSDSEMSPASKTSDVHRLVMRIGKPSHFVPEGAITSACGIVRPAYSGGSAGAVDCLLCMRTKLFKAYA